MKRKDAQMVINKVGAMTCRIEGTMHLLNKEDGTGIEVGMPSLLSIIRGVLAWCDDLLDDDTKNNLATSEQLGKLLAVVGKSIALDIAADDEE